MNYVLIQHLFGTIDVNIFFMVEVNYRSLTEDKIEIYFILSYGVYDVLYERMSYHPLF